MKNVDMLKDIFPSFSENERKFEKEGIPHLSIKSQECFKSKWLDRIEKNRGQVSTLMQKMVQMGSRPNSPTSFGLEMARIRVLDKNELQQKNLMPTISHIMLDRTYLLNDREETTQPYSGESLLIKYLKLKGDRFLAEKLIQRLEEEPWDKIKKIPDLIMIEQLVMIQCLCEYKIDLLQLKKNEGTKIITFALNIARFATLSRFKGFYDLIKDAKYLLGQFTYLINKNSTVAVQAISVLFYRQAFHNVTYCFSKHMEKMCNQLYITYLSHSVTPLQNPEIALKMRVPVEVAKAILTDIGTLNFGVIEGIKNIFLSQKKRPINYEANLAYALEMIEESLKFRLEFEKISAPKSEHMASNEIIRVVLDLPSKHRINQNGVRLTVLIALLSHLRQGKDPSCFAVALSNELLISHLDICLRDLRQILEEDKLLRLMGEDYKQIPFILKIADRNLQNRVTFDWDGFLIIEKQRKGHLSESPGLNAIFNILGIENPQEVLLTIIRDLIPSPTHVHTLELRMLILKICHAAQTNPEINLDRLYEKSSFAFSSQTMQPLLKVWENALATMAEVEEGSMIRSKIVSTIRVALEYELSELTIPRSLLLQRFFLFLQKNMFESIHLQYDPSLFSDSQRDFGSEEGGFVLYNKNQRIDSEMNFRQFVRNIIQEVCEGLAKQEESSSIDELNKVKKILLDYTLTKKFICYLLVRYHPSNKMSVIDFAKGKSTKIAYKNLHYIPWITKIGHDSKALVRMYFESEIPILWESLAFTSAQEALVSIIDLCKRMPMQEKALLLNQPNKLKPLCILGRHRLSFMAGAPSLSKAWQEVFSTQTWIQNFVINPGVEVAESIIDTKTRQSIVFELENKILPDLMPEEKVKVALEFIRLISEGVSIQNYRNLILKICRRVYFTDKSLLIGVLMRKIDTLICKSLEISLKKKLQNSAVHFADTNWAFGVQDIHFCFVVNPGTSNIELWEVCANGDHLAALDQNYWLVNQKWEFPKV